MSEDPQADLDAARTRFNDVCMDPESTEAEFLAAQSALWTAEKARNKAPHTLAGVVWARTPGRVL